MDLTIKDYKFKYIHNENKNCMNIAFYFNMPNDEIHLGDTIICENVMFLNGHIPSAGDPFCCGYCGEKFYNLNASDLVLNELYH